MSEITITLTGSLAISAATLQAIDAYCKRNDATVDDFLLSAVKAHIHAFSAKPETNERMKPEGCPCEDEAYKDHLEREAALKRAVLFENALETARLKRKAFFDGRFSKLSF